MPLLLRTTKTEGTSHLGLCSKCRRLPFHELLWKPKKSSFKTRKIYSLLVGARKCSLCSLIHHAWRRNGAWEQEKVTLDFERSWDEPHTRIAQSRHATGFSMYIKDPASSRPSIRLNVVVAKDSAPDMDGTPSFSALRSKRLTDFEACSSWLRQCSDSHSTCGRIADEVLPGRVIDVSGLRPRLLVTDPRARGQYVTLSHCWGDEKPLQLTKDRLEGFQVLIPFQDLPRTFMHAVIITRRLQYRFLWIDSLCIVQDDEEDWQLECTRMAQIFKNSAFTLAGPESRNPYDGMLGIRTDGACCPSCEISIHKGRLEHWRIRFSHACRPTVDKQTLPFFQRAWIMQERYLSPRVIYFLPERVFFECRTIIHDQNWPKPESTDPSHQRLVRPSNALERACFEKRRWINAGNDSAGRTNIWLELIQSYTRCHTTFNRDRLPAISGLASHFASEQEGEYLAGIWQKDLARGLAWYVDEGARKLSMRKDELTPESYGIPTWSWACQSLPVNFVRYASSNADEDAGRVKFVDYATTYAAEDKYGVIDSGQLTCIGKLRTAFLHYIVSNDTVWAYETSSKSMRVGFLLPDSEYDIRDIDGLEIQCLKLVSREADLVGAQWAALALERLADEPQSFRRIGLIVHDRRSQTHRRFNEYVNGNHLTWHPGYKSRHTDDWFEECESETVCLL